MRTHRLPIRFDDRELAEVRARAATLGVSPTSVVRDAALNAAVETAAERRQAVVALFAIRRELAGLVLLAREGWPVGDAADLRARAWSVAERIEGAIDVLVGEGIAV